MIKKILLPLLIFIGFNTDYAKAGEKLRSALRASERVSWALCKIGVGLVLGYSIKEAILEYNNDWNNKFPFILNVTPNVIPNVNSSNLEVIKNNQEVIKKDLGTVFENLNRHVNTLTIPGGIASIVLSLGLFGSGIFDLGKECISLAKIIHEKIQTKKNQLPASVSIGNTKVLTAT